MRLTAAMKIEKNTEQYWLEHLSFSHGLTFLWNGGTILSFNISEHKEFIWNIQKLILYHACKRTVYRCCRNQSGYGILVLHDFGMRVKCRHIHLLDIDNFSTKFAVCCCGYWLRLQPVLEPYSVRQAAWKRHFFDMLAISILSQQQNGSFNWIISEKKNHFLCA